MMLPKSSCTLFLVLSLLGVCTGPLLSAQEFTNPYRIVTPIDPASVTVGDFNGDGRPDIAWGDTTVSPSVLHILLAQPGGAYLPAASVTLPQSTSVDCQVADFNKDGRIDLVCATTVTTSNQTNVSLQVFLGNGDGTFQAPITTAINPATTPEILGPPADLNNDGIPDLIMGYSSGYYEVQVLLGNGQGGFKPPITILAGNNPPIVADLNGDGKPDLFWPFGPSVSLGNGDGTFTGPFGYAPAASYAACVLHDMDGDGHLDAVCGYIETHTGDITGASDLIILHGNPDGSFNTTPIAQKTFGDHDTQYDGSGTFQYPIAVADLNGDGIPDVLGYSGDGLTVLLGGPNLTFQAPQHYAEAVTADSAGMPLFLSRIADMNGDGLPDLVATGPNGVYITYAVHNGTFLSATAPEVTEIIGYPSVADFNGDGIPDIAATGDTAIKLSLGHGDGTFATPVALPNSSGAINFSTIYPSNAHILHGDLNGDGKQDILAIGSSSPNVYNSYVLFGHGDGTFAPPVIVPNSTIIYPGSSAIADSAVHDINRDGRDDIVFMNSGATPSQQIQSSVSNGDGSFTNVTSNVPADLQSNATLFPNTQPALADFNRDGKLDAVYGGLANAYVVTGNGDGTFASTALALPVPKFNGNASLGVLSVAAGDFDGDGSQDFAELVQYNSAQSIYTQPLTTAAWVYYGNGNGTFSLPVMAGAFDRNYTGIAAADLSRDGLADIVVQTSGSLGGGYAVGVLTSKPARSFGSEVNYTAGTGLSFLSITDLNRDGFPDLVFGNGDSNILASSVTVLLNLGNTPQLTGQITASPEPSYVTGTFTMTASLALSTPGTIFTGNVAFSIDGVSVGSAPLSANGATIAGPTTLAAGVHTISATWPGNGTYGPITVSAQHTVALVPLQILLTSLLNPSSVGQSVTFTTQFTPVPEPGVILQGYQYRGTTTLYDGATALPSFTTSTLSAGSHSMTAVNSGDTFFAPATSNIVSQVVQLHPSAATLYVTPATAPFGSPFYLTATIGAVNSYTSPDPTGTVRFFVDGAPYVSVTLVASSTLMSTGIATTTVTGLNVGTHTFTCLYAGDTTYGPSACNTVPVTVTATATALTVTSAPNPSFALSPVTFTAHLTSGTQPEPGNTVLLAIGTNAPIALTTDTNGNATYTASALTPGTYPVTATFAATANLFGSTASTTQVVNAIPTTTTLTVAPNPAYQGQPVTLTASVFAPVSGVLSGSVTFLDAGVSIGTGTLNASGQAIFTTTSLAVGTHPLTATYALINYLPSTSPVVNEVILPSSFTISLSPSSITLPPGEQGTVAIHLASVGNFAGPLILTYGPLPAYATATITPPSVTLTAAAGSGSATLTLNTLQTSSANVRSGVRWPVVLAGLLLLPIVARRRRRLGKLLGILCAAVLLQTLTGCTNNWYEGHFVSAGTYQVSVTATDINFNSQSAILTVVVP